ncbi:MAG: hypothetical protein KF791_09055 [Verrucomicrobiae bacterium]|nr:hypothetical protein [Verrucomicrobiae bacterium]
MTDAPNNDPEPLVIEKSGEFTFATPVLDLEVAPDGATIFAACQDGSVVRVSATSGERSLLGWHSSYASGVARVPGRPWVISGGYDGRLLWHDIESNAVMRDVRAHDFWSWDLAVSRDGRWVVSGTGRYEAGGYRYEPAPGGEPGVVVLDVADGSRHRAWGHVPPVQAVAISPDGRHVAAGNLMGTVRVWDRDEDRLVSEWTDDGLTSWGIIKSHHFLGGIFAMAFSPDGADLYVCGMGPMRDPMAGNGVQRWQRFDWRTGRRLDQTHDGESGQGLMETLAFSPDGSRFVMAGRLFQGSWNLALFAAADGRKLQALDAKHRITGVCFSGDGRRLYVSKARGQERPKDGRWADSGLVEVFDIRDRPPM